LRLDPGARRIPRFLCRHGQRRNALPGARREADASGACRNASETGEDYSRPKLQRIGSQQALNTAPAFARGAANNPVFVAPCGQKLREETVPAKHGPRVQLRNLLLGRFGGGIRIQTLGPADRTTVREQPVRPLAPHCFAKETGVPVSGTDGSNPSSSSGESTNFPGGSCQEYSFYVLD
jgi:hypothetical protein